MSITRVSSPTIDNAFGTSTTISKPTGLSNGNVLVWEVVNTVANNPSPPSGTINTPSGWTALISQTEISGARGGGTFFGSIRSAWFYRVVDGSEGSSFTATGTASTGTPGMASFMVGLSGVDTTTPLDTSTTNTGLATGTTITATGLTVGSGIVGGYLVATIDTWEADRGPLTGMTEIANFSGNAGALDEQTGLSAGSVASKTCSCTSTEFWITSLISLNPASSAGLITAYWLKV